jgi:hypothetical protein
MVTQTIQWTRQRALHKHGIILRVAGAVANEGIRPPAPFIIKEQHGI